ncbi:MAG: PAAR domain-containing protein [Pseudomonadota bacterium]
MGSIAHCPNDAHGCPACPHPVRGPIQSGSPYVLIEGKPAARVGDSGIHAACCGPNTFMITTGDPNVLIDGKPAARLGDQTKHCGGVGKIVSTQ